MSVQHSDKVEEETRKYDDSVVFEDGVEIMLDGSIEEASRWQKYGNDRLYPRFAEEGYIDLKEGEATDFEMRNDVGHGVGGYKLRLDSETGKIALLACPDETMFAPDATADEIPDPVVKALIPCEVLQK